MNRTFSPKKRMAGFGRAFGLGLPPSRALDPFAAPSVNDRYLRAP